MILQFLRQYPSSYWYINKLFVNHDIELTYKASESYFISIIFKLKAYFNGLADLQHEKM